MAPALRCSIKFGSAFCNATRVEEFGCHTMLGLGSLNQRGGCHDSRLILSSMPRLSGLRPVRRQSTDARAYSLNSNEISEPDLQGEYFRHFAHQIEYVPVFWLSTVHSVGNF